MDSRTNLISITFILFVTVVSCNQIQVDSGPYSCWECNVWKAGYGNICENPRNRSGCWSCMKFQSTVFMGFYKNTPRYTTVISRACVKTLLVEYVAGCRSYHTVDGHNERCTCFGHNCNPASTTIPPPSLFFTLFSFLLSIFLIKTSLLI